LVAWPGLFSAAELDTIVRLGDGLAKEKAELSGGGVGYENIRSTQVAWVTRGPETEMLYQRMEQVILDINARYFRFDLSGLALSSMRFTADRKAGISTGTRIMAATLPIPARSRAS
jgi:hypothetical protein